MVRHREFSRPASIGGKLDYCALAQRHRPHYATEMAAAIRDLTKQGLRPYDISVSLGIGIDAVTALLESTPITPSAVSRSEPLPVDEAAAIHAAAWTNPHEAGDAGKESK